VAMAAGLASLQQIRAPGFYESLFEKTDRLVQGLHQAAAESGIPFTSNHVGSMFGAFFTTEEKITNYQQVINCDIETFNRFFHGMLEQGVYLAPASYEAGFMSAAHSDEDIENTIKAARNVMQGLV